MAGVRLRARLARKICALNSVSGRNFCRHCLNASVMRGFQKLKEGYLTGESGTGKELIAAALHEHSPRAAAPFVKVSVRIVTATNRNLLQRVKQGLFREDLYYRRNVVAIDMPPLRERPADIPLLAQHFLDRYAKKNDKAITAFSEGAMGRLVRCRSTRTTRLLLRKSRARADVCRYQISSELARLLHRLSSDVSTEQR